jgi:hypothetical protein
VPAERSQGIPYRQKQLGKWQSGKKAIASTYSLLNKRWEMPGPNPTFLYSVFMEGNFSESRSRENCADSGDPNIW